MVSYCYNVTINFLEIPFMFMIFQFLHQEKLIKKQLSENVQLSPKSISQLLELISSPHSPDYKESIVPLYSEKRAKYIWRHCFMVMWSFAFCTLFLVHVAHLLPQQRPSEKKECITTKLCLKSLLFASFLTQFILFFVFIYLFLCCLRSLSKPQIYLSTWQVSFFSGAIAEKNFFSAIMFTKKEPPTAIIILL